MKPKNVVFSNTTEYDLHNKMDIRMKSIPKLYVLILLAVLSMILIWSKSEAQETTFRDRAVRYGGHLGFNSNYASLGFQDLHEPFHNFDKPNTDNEKVNGDGIGGYFGATVEYLSSSWWGVQIRVSYDMRDATIKDIYPTPNTEFITRLGYILFEPALRIDQHIVPNLSFTAGPLIAVNLHGTYDYKADASGPVTDADLTIPNRSVASLGVTVGVAYDIEFNRTRNSSVYCVPFLDYSYVASQRKSVIDAVQNSTNDIWSTQTIRVGIRVSWESRTRDEDMTPTTPPGTMHIQKQSPSKVSVMLPYNNTVTSKIINGYFPIQPYVFFDKGNNEIPTRYTRLTPDEAKRYTFSELSNFDQGDMTVKETNIDQLMVVYRSCINIFADRMRKNPSEQLVLRGSDPEEVNGETYALKVKEYMVNSFGIDPKRITVSVEPPRVPSGSALTDPEFKSMIDDENRRVTFVFSNQSMLIPVSYAIKDESSIDNDMVFRISDSISFNSWQISITGANRSMEVGPCKYRSERVNVAPLISGLDRGSYNAKVVITTKDGRKITEDLNFDLYKTKELKNASRYLMIFEYNQSDAVRSYETKIRNEIVPSMVAGNRVIVHGHTDIIGSEDENQLLSQRRADEAKGIIDDQLRKEDKIVNVQAIGIGQANMHYSFNNKYPEGRMYNRNVFVEIIK